jgi:hypothetical protein
MLVVFLVSVKLCMCKKGVVAATIERNLPYCCTLYWSTLEVQADEHEGRAFATVGSN